MKKEKNKICPICNNKLGFLKNEFKDGIRICSKCFNDSGITLSELLERGQKNISIEEIKSRINDKNDNQSYFTATKKIGNFVAFDDNQQKWATLTSITGKVKQIFNYSDIVNFELLEDGNSVATGGLGRALVGGAIFGGTGAIVGGVTGKRKTKEVCTSLRLKVTINDIKNPVVYINFIESKTKKSGLIYKAIAEQAQECLSVFQLICDKQNSQENSNQASTADEIRKFKELFDEGIITKEEFDQKKKELLGL